MEINEGTRRPYIFLQSTPFSNMFVVCIQTAESVFEASVSGLDTSGRIWVSGRGFLGLPQ